MAFIVQNVSMECNLPPMNEYIQIKYILSV